MHPQITDAVLGPFYPSTSNSLPDDLINKCTGHIESLDRAIDAAKQNITCLSSNEDLESAKENLQELFDERARCSSLLSPIRQVPIEILSKIIVHLLGCPRLLYRNDVARITTIQLVCREWYNATYSTSDLWRCLGFGDISRFSDRLNHGLLIGDILETWFNRAGMGGPLCLWIKCRSQDMDDVANKVVQLQSLRSFLLKPRPFAELDLDVERRFFKELTEEIGRRFASDGSPWTRVERLGVHLQPYFHPTQHIHLPGHALPRMTYLLAGGALQPFAHSNLRTLQLECATYRSCVFIDFLSNLPSLKRLIIRGSDTDIQGPYTDDDRAKLARVTVSHLTIWGAVSPALTSYFMFPALRTLQVSPAGNWSHWLRVIPPFLNSSLDIQTLYLRDRGRHAPDNIAAILSQIHSLRRLYVRRLDLFSSLSPSTSVLQGLEEIVAAERPSLDSLKGISDYFAHWREIDQSSGRIRLHSESGWPEGLSEIQETLAKIGVEIVSKLWHEGDEDSNSLSGISTFQR